LIANLVVRDPHHHPACAKSPRDRSDRGLVDSAELLSSLAAEAADEDDATPEEIEKAWAEEIERRVSNVLEGRSQGRPAAEAIAEIRARLHAARAR